VSAGPKHNILASQSSQLGDAQARLDSDKKKCSITAPNPGRKVRNRKQSIDLFAVKKLNRPALMPFVGYCQNSLAMQRVSRFLQSHVLEKRVERCQPSIPSASGVLTNGFQVFEENAKKGCVEIFDPKL
jgi:hypothetical protein